MARWPGKRLIYATVSLSHRSMSSRRVTLLGHMRITLAQKSRSASCLCSSAVADFQEAKERKSLVLEALFEVLFRILKHAAGGGARRTPQQNSSTAAADAGAHTRLPHCACARLDACCHGALGPPFRAASLHTSRSVCCGSCCASQPFDPSRGHSAACSAVAQHFDISCLPARMASTCQVVVSRGSGTSTWRSLHMRSRRHWRRREARGEGPRRIPAAGRGAGGRPPLRPPHQRGLLRGPDRRAGVAGAAGLAGAPAATAGPGHGRPHQQVLLYRVFSMQSCHKRPLYAPGCPGLAGG